MSRCNFEKGHLKPGIYELNGQEFLEEFMKGDHRKGFSKAVTDIFDFAYETNAEYLFIGGSFVSLIEKPNDIDCLIVYKDSASIPQKSEVFLIDNMMIDIMFASLDYKAAVDSYIHLFTHNKYGLKKGAVQVTLNNTNGLWNVIHPSGGDYELIKQAYINRLVRVLNEPKGILVTIHGLMSSGDWNQEIAPIASSEGWIVAPYFYKGNTPDLLVNSRKKKKCIDDFRKWIYELSERFETNISVIAHSFGTYILASYLDGFEDPPVEFDVIILTGSILTENYDWEKHKGKKVGRVLNEIAPNDSWVAKMKKGSLILQDSLFGISGTEGFSKNSTILEQTKNDIFNHNNVIERDVIQYKWIPFLNANRGSLHSSWLE